METEYLCDVVNRAFQRRSTALDVVWSFAGIRALQDDGSMRASAVTRDYALDLDAPAGTAPSLSIVGGKLTTYRILAEQVLGDTRALVRQLRPPWTGSVPLPGGDIGGGNPEALAPALSRLYPFLDDAHGPAPRPGLRHARDAPAGRRRVRGTTWANRSAEG